MYNTRNNTNYFLATAMAERDILDRLTQKFEKELSCMPEGSITRKQINGTIYFYHSLKQNDKRLNYFIQKRIKKSQTELVKLLIRKQFLQKALKLLKGNVKVVEEFIKTYQPFFPSLALENMQYELEAISESFFSKSVMIENWLKEPYESNSVYPENLIHTTIKGLRVRSKSEALIAGVLEMNDIPYRYEAKITIDDQDYFPDFTIFKPSDGRIIYWEHYGKINDPAYLYTMTQKQIAYIRKGILPWDNLITTYDSEIGSINMMTINSIIKALLLV